MAKIDYNTETITFPNGVVDDELYEPHDVVEVQLSGHSYYLGFGHEEIVIWDLEGKRLFSVHTR